MKAFHLSSVTLSLLISTMAVAENPAIIPVPRPASVTNWISRHEEFVALAKKERIDLLFLGDSITDRWRTKGSNVWNKVYAPYRAANFGIGGDRTQHVLWRIEHGELDGVNPKVIVLMIGTNNSNSDSADEVAEGVERIVAEIRDRCPDSKLLLLAIFPRNKTTDKPGQMDMIREVNQCIARLDDGQMIRFLDLTDRFLGPDYTVPTAIMPDFLHPEETGYIIWANAMNPLLEEMLK